ncbi:MAG: hypothetical protein IJ043_03230 [Clostridia bacterium]|nr:hypothetical protein [Clostridia bacterium]
MPRIKMPPKNKKPFRGIASAIKDYADEYGMTIPEVAKRSKMCPATLYNRLHNPENFALSELKTICLVVQAPFAEIIELAKKY